MKTILVTGATGYLGQAIVNELIQYDEFDVIAIGGRPEDKINPLPEHPRLRLYPLDNLFTHSFQDVDTVINCAFARSNDAALLAQAFDFTKKLINRLVMLKVKSVINISSQGVYKRLPAGELSSEDSPVEPVDLYSMAKYASEKLFLVSAIPHVTNVRLASLMMSQRFLYFFVKKAREGESFRVSAPYQYASLLDVRDAASALVSIAKRSPDQRAMTYNLGTGRQYSLLEYAESVKAVGERFGYSISFDVVDNGTCISAGMNCARLMSDTGWSPKYLKNEMIEDLFKSKQL